MISRGDGGVTNGSAVPLNNRRNSRHLILRRLPNDGACKMNEAVVEIERHTPFSADEKPDGFCRVIADRRLNRLTAPLDLRPQFGDLLRNLEIVNRGVNGEVPSKTFGRRRSIEGPLTFAMQDIIHTGLEWCLLGRRQDVATVGESDHAAVVVWAISYCWMAIMHGDIDSLEVDLKAELAVRGLPEETLWTGK